MPPSMWSSDEEEESSSSEGEEEESTWPPTEEEQLISSFIQVAVGQSPQTAAQFLQATGWKLDKAIQLFYEGSGGVGGGDGGGPLASSSASVSGGDDDGVRPPLPVMRGTLYDDAATLYAAGERASRLDEETSKRDEFWKDDERLESLYRPPSHLMFKGSFEGAKEAASMDNKWLLVNLQSTEEFTSHVLNRDTWSNKSLCQTIRMSFVFWQGYIDHSTDEGTKVCTYYNIDSVPVVLVIDPITGQRMRSWFGMVKPEKLLEDLVVFIMDKEGGPKDYHPNPRGKGNKRGRGGASCSSVKPPKRSRLPLVEEEEMLVKAIGAASMNAAEEEEEKKPKCTYPPLPEEPKGSDRSLLCRVGVRLRDGRRVQRSFLRTDPIQLLWSFCHSQLDEADQSNTFRLILAIPGASQILDYDSKLTFEESRLANSMVSVARD